MSTQLEVDTYDDIQIGSGYYVYGVDDDIEKVATTLERAETELDACDRSLDRLEKAVPLVAFTLEPVIGHINGNPAQAWLAVEDAISYARFSASGISEVNRKAFELKEKIIRAREQYWDAEQKIQKRMKQGDRLADNLLATAYHAALRHTFGTGTVSKILGWTGMNREIQTVGALLQGNRLEVLKAALARGTLPGFISSGFRTGAREEIIDELFGMIEGTNAVTTSPEEFVAGMLGVYAGVTTRPIVPLPFEGVVLSGAASPLAFFLHGNINKAIEAALLEPLPETVVRQESKRYGSSPPAQYSDVADRLADQYIYDDEEAYDNEAQFEIELITQPDGETVARVYMAGMRYPYPHDSHPNDAAANFNAIQQNETAQSRAVKEALLDLDLPQGTKVSFAGHSKGGMDAINLSMDPQVRNQFDVVSVETFGTPVELLKINGTKIEGTAKRDLPLDTEYINLQHNGDPVPGSDMAPPMSGPNRTDFRLSEHPVANPDAESMVVEAHSIHNYAKSADRVEQQGSPEFQRWEEAASETLGQDGAKSVTYTYRVKKAAAVTDPSAE